MLLDPLRWARYYATTKHAGQLYGNGLPYTYHLNAVEQVLRRFGFTSEDILQAAHLHDVLEDTKTKKRELAEFFEESIVDLVWRVTNEPGPNRAERNKRTYPKIRESQNAIILKLADRIANVEFGGDMVKKYKEEYPMFREALYTNKAEEMWAHLDSLLK